MLGGDAAKNGGSAELGTPQLLQGVHFIGQLAQGFFDQLGLAAGAGGAQGQAALVEIEGGGGQRFAVQRSVVQVVQPQLDLGAQALAGLRLRIGWQ
ncbi:hypothetical protein D3C78_1321980 [compost metagenome]